MTKPPLATTISSLLVASMIFTPALTYAASPQATAENEEIRRQDYLRRGMLAMESGDRAMGARDYEKATGYYRQACDFIPNASATKKQYQLALNNFSKASCLFAEQRIAEGRYGDAQAVLHTVLEEQYNPRYKDAIKILAQLEDPEWYNKTIGPGFRANVEKVKQLMIDAKGYYDTGRYDLAFKRCEQVLNIDPYNKAARYMEEQINRAKSDYYITGYNEARSRAVAAIDKAWVNPVRRFNIDPNANVIENTRTTDSNIQRTTRKLERIILPRVEFKDATIREAIEYLKRKSVELDQDDPKTGVNIVLKLDSVGAGVSVPDAVPAASPSAIPGLDTGAVPTAAPVVASVGAGGGDQRITVSLSNIPLGEALKYVTGLANLKYKVEPYAIYVVPLSAQVDSLITKEWKVRPDLIPRASGAAPSGALGGTPTFGAAPGATGDATRGGSGIADRESAKAWLIASGAQFNNPGASAIYIASSSRLIVRNTQDQLDLIETIIQSTNPTNGPTQVEIEAKFVEISQNNFKELSFDWLLGQANFPANKNVFFGGGTAGTSAGVNPLDYPFVAPGNQVVGQYPLTSGNRSGSTAIKANAVDALLFGTANPTTLLSPAIGAVAGVFTDPQFQVVIRALNQKKGVDLLSAPRVTTKSGQRAVIEIIREFKFPTEFEPPQIPQTFGGNFNNNPIIPGVIGGQQQNNTFPVTPTTPTAFETRNTGVTLEVEPVVGPDGYTIDLNLVPQVVEFEGFINYGSPIQTTNTDLLGRPVVSVITPNVINQPIFSTRKVTTSVSVYDGNTVVIGGLMREDVQKVEDKVPLLGDIPILGRLFRSSVDQHLKRNLVIFVSARLMNPAGEPVRQEEEREEVIELAPPPDLGLPELPFMPK